MRKASTFVALVFVAMTGPAFAQDGAAPGATAGSTASPATASPAVADANASPPSQRKPWDIDLALLPMAEGRFTTSPGGVKSTTDAAFAYGVGLSGNRAVFRGLSVGVAPQAIFNVKGKADSGDAAKELDLLARVAYTQPMVDGITVYAEALPGYSILQPPSGSKAKGFALALGVGSQMDLGDRVFATLGVGYQLGFQKLSQGGVTEQAETRYLRCVIGAGARF